ncbi:cyclase [Actinocrispum sp. NPDC049592]|uniref:cyclase n=1 Tax=Actinocrispum sp. NPDC049592 TaxID=3154835 RepID=UPI0034178D61
MLTSRFAKAAALALVPVLAFGTTAAAANQTITYKVRATALGQTADLTLDQGVDASAPATVAPGGALKVVIDPAPNTVPATGGGYTIREINTVALKLPVPANSTFVSASLSGGSGLGSTPPTVSKVGNDVVLSVKGPLKGGAAFELPTVTVNLTAGSSGTIQTKLGGTSYDAPGLTFNAVVVVIFPITAPAKAYPDPSPVLTSTTIG